MNTSVIELALIFTDYLILNWKMNVDVKLLMTLNKVNYESVEIFLRIIDVDVSGKVVNYEMVQ